MTALLLALCLAAGAGLIWMAIAYPAVRRQQQPAGEPLLTALEQLAGDAGLGRLGGRGLVALSLAAALLGYAVAAFTLGWTIFGLLVAGLAAYAPIMYARARADAHRERLGEAVADAVDTLRQAIRAGATLEQAFAALAESGPTALRPYLREASALATVGGDLRAALGAAARAIRHPTFDRAAVALLVAQQVGGRNTSVVLDGLSRALREQTTVRREARAGQARNVMSARILAGLPWVLIIAMRLINPLYASAFGDFAGQMVLLLVGAMIAAGYFIMLRIIALPQEVPVRW